MSDLVDTAVLIAQIGSVAFVAARVAGRLVANDRPRTDLALVGVTIAIAQVCAAGQLLGALHLIDRWALLALHVVAAIAVLRLVAPEPRTTPSDEDAAARRVATMVAFGIAAMAAIISLERVSRHFETRHYHLTIVGSWLRAGHIWDLPFAGPGLFTNAYPSNVELTALWLTLPSGADGYARLVNVGWGALLVLGTAVAARELGGREWVGMLGGCAVVLSPLVWSTQTNAVATDVGCAAGLVAGVALLLVGLGQPDQRRWTILAGIALGLAVGAKYTAFVPAAAVCMLAVLLPGRTGTLRRLALLLGPIAALAGFWLVRDLIHTGNPLFPLEVAIGDRTLLTGGETPLDIYETPMLSHLLHWKGSVIETWWHFARYYVGWLGIATTVALAATGGWRDRRRLLLAAVALISFVAYLATPYTGGGEEGAVILVGSQVRYALPALALATPLIACLRPALAMVAIAPALAYGAVEASRGAGFRSDLDLSAGLVARASLLAAVAVAIAGVLRRGTVAQRRLTVAAVAVVALASSTLFDEVLGSDGRIESLLASTGTSGPILVLSGEDLRELQGEHLQIGLTRVTAGGAAGEIPILDADELDRRVQSSGAEVLALRNGASPMTPQGWVPPPPWRVAATFGATDVYVLVPDG